LQFGHTLWGSFGSWHCGHTDNAGADFTIFADFLELVFALDVFLFGTAMLTPPFSDINFLII
jgi:hypothetical protein